MNRELWLKLVEYEILCKRHNHQIGRLRERIKEFEVQNTLDQTISPEKMAEIVVDFFNKEDERKEHEQEQAGKRRNKRYKDLIRKRINDIKSTPKPERPAMSLDYQLGYMIGDQIVDRYLITLSNERGTRNVIEISSEEQAEYDRLHEIWSVAYNIDKNNSNEEWTAYRDFANSLQKKYLPPKLECYIGRIESVNKIEDIKQGIRDSLWNCDVCCYDTEVIEIVEDVDWFSKVIIYLEKPEVCTQLQ